VGAALSAGLWLVLGDERIAAALPPGESPYDTLCGRLTLGVSLFNALLLVFLGLTVLLTSARRSWGVWLVGLGLFLGAAVFLDNARSAGEAGAAGVTILFHSWWPVGWVPVVALPLAWHVAMLWYIGSWAPAPSAARKALRRRHMPWLVLSGALALTGCLVLGIPAYLDRALMVRIETLSPWGVPLLPAGYCLFVLCATAAPAWALARPAPALELWRDLGRERARPWLIGASAFVFASGVAIAYVVLPIIGFYGRLGIPTDYEDIVRLCAWCDLTISALVGVVVLLLGQAVVAYEVFAGRTLPRRGLRRHAVTAAVLSLAYALLVPAALIRWPGPVQGYLLGAVLAVALYAVLAWASYGDQERQARHLRPLVGGRHVFDELRAAHGGAESVRADESLRALCEDLLEAESLALVPTGPFAPLIGAVLTHPQGGDVPTALAARLSAERHSPGGGPQVLPPGTAEGYAWSVPLWGARGMTGLLLLGPKRHGGLYTQEEIETAQLIAERLLDTEASFRLAERLMELQRRRLAESQVLDRRMRREIHDEVLPRLHAALLRLPPGEADPERAAVVEELGGVHRRLAGLLREMPPATPEVERLGLVAALRRELAGPLSGAFEAVEWIVDAAGEEAAGRLSPVAREVLFYAAREALRNAAAHARGDETDLPLHLRVSLASEGDLRLTVEDDGLGLGATRREKPAGGRGLALHSTMMAILGGDLLVESVEPHGTRVLLVLPEA
jgi:signal transduction histidine kinase